MTWWTSEKLQPKVKSKFLVVFGDALFLPNVKSITKPKVEFETKDYTLLNHKFNYPGNGTWQPVDVKFVDMNGLGDRDTTFDTAAFLWQMLNNTGYAYPYLDNDSAISTNPYYTNIYKGVKSNTHGHHIATKMNFRDDPRTTDIKEGKSWRNLTTPEKSSTIANSFGGGLLGEIDNKQAGIKRQKVSIYQISPSGENDLGKGATITEAWHLVNPIIKTIDWGDLAYDSDELIEYTLNIVYDWAIYDREIIGSSTNEIGYDAGSYQKFMKQWNLAQDNLKKEEAIQQAEIALAELREKIQKDDRLNRDGTVKNDTLEKAENLYKDNPNPLVDQPDKYGHKADAASKNEYYSTVRDIFDEQGSQGAQVLVNEDEEDVFDIDGDGQISEAEQYLADTGETDVFSRAEQMPPSMSGNRMGDRKPPDNKKDILPGGSGLDNVPTGTTTDNADIDEPTPGFQQQDSSPPPLDQSSPLFDEKLEDVVVIEDKRVAGGGTEYSENKSLAEQFGVDTDKPFVMGTRINSQGEQETTLTGVDNEGNEIFLIIED